MMTLESTVACLRMETYTTKIFGDAFLTVATVPACCDIFRFQGPLLQQADNRAGGNLL